MLKLVDVKKIYAEKSDSSVKALKGISLNFRKSEFVSILGPSGCGKTTLLNIIGGLDRYTSGDLVINGTSTKEYTDKDWDTYRNHSVGFVFQSYNLIPHQTILENVELTMTLGGVSKNERKKRAKEALIAVGLGDKLNKRPNQLSGGQMQRVSIARALVGDPDIILADEPTGALDTETSVAVMDLLKEISKNKLVIMVTHNPELAFRYSDRIIKMLDGVIEEDSFPYSDEEESNEERPVIFNSATETEDGKLKYNKKHSSMSFLTALRLSATNLLSKKRRTIITSIASSIGLIGMAIILSVSSGMQSYIDKTMLDSAAFNYVVINSTTTSATSLQKQNSIKTDMEEYPEGTTGVYPYEEQTREIKKQKLNKEFIDYLETKTTDLVVDITYSYNAEINALTKNGEDYFFVDTSNWSESLHNEDFLAEYYTVLAKENGVNSAIPSNATEIALVVDKYNRLEKSILESLGISVTEKADGSFEQIDYADLIGKEFRIVYNDGWYTQDSDGWYKAANTSNYQTAYENENGITLKIVSVLREKEETASSWLSTGIAYSPELTKLVLEKNKNSAVALAQVESKTIDVTTGTVFSTGTGGGLSGIFGGNSTTYESKLEELGYTQTPTAIAVYPVDVASREKIIGLLDTWNSEHKGTDATIEYIDMSSIMTSMLGTIVEIITYVLLAFSITSLVISSIMIAIIIYASVIERTKEIGVLRSIGARKKDISRVFKAEAVLLGAFSGIIAIVLTLVINVGINGILSSLAGVSTIASLSLGTALGLVALSVVLMLLSSLIPARIAAKKEPAVALRTE